jgi:phage gpG-like protein
MTGPIIYSATRRCCLMIQVEVRGTELIVSRLAQMARTGKNELLKALGKAANRVQKQVVLNIGVTFKRKGSSKTRLNPGGQRGDSGLAGSIRAVVDRVRMEARVGTDVVYARIHEFGGKTRRHDIRPRNKQVLAWPTAGGYVTKSGEMKRFYGGKSKAARKYGWTYAMVVDHPGSKIPARPYLFPAYQTQADNIKRDFEAALTATVGGGQT